jgi:hypothetical protein
MISLHAAGIAPSPESMSPMCSDVSKSNRMREKGRKRRGEKRRECCGRAQGKFARENAFRPSYNKLSLKVGRFVAIDSLKY